MTDHPDGDYEVGYGKPPRQGQFQPGQSGNPRGRPKGSRGLKTDLHAELVSKMTIQINGQPITATKQQLMVKTLATRAASGDVRAIKALIDLVMQVFGAEDRGEGRKQLSAQDQQIFDEVIGQRAMPSSDEPRAATRGTPDLQGEE